MVGLREGDAHVGAGVRATRCAAAAEAFAAARRCAARLRIAPHAAHDPAFEGEHGAAAERDEQAAVLDEALELGEALPADAARDVVRLCGRAVARRLRRLLEGHRAPGLRQAVDLLGQLEVDVAVEEHVDTLAQVARADVLVAHVGVGNAALVERVAHPADGVGVGPRHPARRAAAPARHVARRRGARRRSTKSRPDPWPRPSRHAPRARPARAGSTSLPETRRSPTRNGRSAISTLKLGEPVARREQPFLARVLEQEDRAGAVHRALTGAACPARGRSGTRPSPRDRPREGPARR